MTVLIGDQVDITLAARRMLADALLYAMRSQDAIDREWCQTEGAEYMLALGARLPPAGPARIAAVDDARARAQRGGGGGGIGESVAAKDARQRRRDKETR